MGGGWCSQTLREMVKSPQEELGGFLFRPIGVLSTCFPTCQGEACWRAPAPGVALRGGGGLYGRSSRRCGLSALPPPPIHPYLLVHVSLPGTPRQGALAPSTRGVLRLSAEVSGDALDGLAGFSHLWVL